MAGCGVAESKSHRKLLEEHFEELPSEEESEGDAESEDEEDDLQV